MTHNFTEIMANETLKQYDRGVCWEEERLEVKGSQWKAAYLPVWLYSYQEVKNEKSNMNKTYTINVEGMMCEKCREHVENALKAAKGVKAVEVSLKEKKARITANTAVTEDMLKDVIVKAGYKVV